MGKNDDMKKRAVVIILLFFTVGLIFSFFLFGQKIFADADATLQNYPLYIVNSQEKNINWIPQILGGHYNALWDSNFSLNNVFVAINHFLKNPITAYHWMIYFYFCLGGLFCYLFARKLHFTRIVALSASWCYILSEFCFYRGRIASNSRNFFFLPLLFYLLIKLKENKKAFIPITGIIIGFFIWVGHSQYIMYCLLAGFFYVVGIDWKQYDCAKSFWSNWEMIKSYILIGIISLPIAFPFLYRALTAAEATSFNAGFTSSSLSNSSGIALIDLLRFLSPYLYINNFSNLPALLYIGTFSFLLLLIGIVYAARKNKYALFFSFLFFFFLIMSFTNSPLFYLFSRIPLINRFHNRTRFIFLVVFAGAILVGYGLQYLLDKKQDIIKFISVLKYFVSFSILGVIFSNLVSMLWLDNIILLVNNYFDQYKYNNTKAFSLEYYHQIISSKIKNYFYLFDVGNSKFLVPFIFLLIGYLLLELYQREKITLKKFEIVCATVIILNFILIYPMYHQTISQTEYLEEPQTISFIKSRESNPFEYRVLGFRLSDFMYRNVVLPSNNDQKILIKFQQETIQPNTNLLFNIHSLDGYDQFMQERNSLFIGQIGSDNFVIETITPLINRDDLSAEEKINLFIERINLLALFNVKYIVTPHKLETEKVVLVDEEKVTDLQIPVYIYEIKNFMPRLYFAKDIKFVKVDNESGLQLLLDNTDKVLDKTFIECADCSYNNEILNQVQNDNGNIQNDSLITIQRYESGYLEAEINTEKDRWMVFNENNIAGWKAYIDNEQTDIYATNYLMQGIFVPQGKHKIIFKFQ